MKRDTAAKFSFYLSTPIIGGAVAKKMLDILKEHAGIEQLPQQRVLRDGRLDLRHGTGKSGSFLPLEFG